MNAPTAAATAPEDTSRAKGPIVWLDMDQQALDDAYDQLVYAPNRDQLTQRRIINSAAARKRIGDPLRFAYGPTPVEGLDVFRSNGRAGAPGDRLGLSQRRQIRRRSRAALSDFALLRLASCRLCGDARLGQGGIAARHSQGRDGLERHVRSQAGAALQALKICEVHRRDGAGAVRDPPSRQARNTADRELWHL